MADYLIVDIEVTDPEAFERYKRAVAPNLASFGARYLTRGGRTMVLEGEWSPRRLVILEFPSMARLEEWYRSPKGRIPIIPGSTNDREVIQRAVAGCDGVLVLKSTPSSSLNRTRHGMAAWPISRYAVRSLPPGRAALPPRSGWLEGWASTDEAHQLPADSSPPGELKK